MSYDIGPRIGVEGEAEFKQSLASINAEIKTLGTEMQAVTSGFAKNEQSMEALTAQNEVLAKQSEAYAKKLEVLNQDLEENTRKHAAAEAKLAALSREYQNAANDLGYFKDMAAEGGERSAEFASKIDAQAKQVSELGKALAKAQAEYNSTESAVQKNQQEINKATAAMNKSERAIRDNETAMEGLASGTKEAGKALDDGAGAALSFGDVLKANVVSDLILSGVKLLGDGLKAAFNALKDAAYAADDLNTLSKQTGISTDELQKFQYASELIDVSMDTLTGSMSKLTKNMATAAKGTGDAYNAFQTLGVAVTDEDGALRDRNEVFQEAIGALGEMTNETERDALAMEIFGKSAQDLNPLILGGADALEALGQQAEEAGLILSEGQLNDLNRISDGMDTLKATASAAGGVLLSGFAEPAAEALEFANDALTDLLKAFQENGVQGMGEAAGEMISSLVSGFIESLPEILKTAGEIVSALVKGVAAFLPDVLDAGVKMLEELVDGILEAIPEMIDRLPEVIDGFLGFITAHLPDVVMKGNELLGKLGEGIIKAIPQLLSKLPHIINSLVSFFQENWPKMLKSGVDLLGQLVTGLIDALPEIGRAVGEIVVALVKGFLDLRQTVREVGFDIVSGIWEGISSKVEWFKEKVSGFFTGIVDGVKDALGIQSPSKVFAGIGENMAAGLGEGWEDEIRDVKRDIESGMTFGNIADSWSDLSATAYSGRVSNADAGLEAAAGVVNGLAGSGGDLPTTLTVNLVLPDGSHFATWVLPDLIRAADAAGTPISSGQFA